jgi:GNAT superfamily N-acetyltransferase
MSAAGSDFPTRRITVYYLEMHAPSEELDSPSPESFHIHELTDPPLDFYRYIYGKVGRDWGWSERLQQPDEALRAIITPPNGTVYIAYWHGYPAGVAEMNLSGWPDVQLNYFALIPELVGKGIGKHFLAAVIARVWSMEPRPRRLWLHTCSADSPCALPCYKRAGFVQYDVREVEEPVPTAS